MSLMRPVRGNIQTDRHADRHEDGEFYILDVPKGIIGKRWVKDGLGDY